MRKSDRDRVVENGRINTSRDNRRSIAAASNCVSSGNSSCRYGFSLIELLVVCAIIGIVVAIAIPAIQTARESSRRMTCQSSLRQLGLALHSYSDMCSTLPINMGPHFGSAAVPPSRVPLNGKGWIVSVLPHIEQKDLFDSFAVYFAGDFREGRGLNAQGCRSLMKTQLAALKCPSDWSVRRLSINQYQWDGVEVSLTSYKGVIGDTRLQGSMHDGSTPDCHGRGGCDGLFFRTTYREPQRFAFVTDGMSDTFMIGEDVVSQNDHSAAFYANGDYASCHAPLNYFFKPPNPRDWSNVMSFRSLHNGGANFCMVDGSVRFVSQSIDHDLYRALSTKGKGEVAVLP